MKIDASFERISKYANNDGIKLPTRKTTGSAGYDFYVAENTIIPSYITHLRNTLADFVALHSTNELISLEEMSNFTKEHNCRPTLVPTGIKCRMPEDYYLQLSVRSSLPLKNWLILANGVGIIDSDYYNNPDNEGHIFFQLFNLTAHPILLKRGDCFGQGILLPYGICANEDKVTATRNGGFGSTSA